MLLFNMLIPAMYTKFVRQVENVLDSYRAIVTSPTEVLRMLFFRLQGQVLDLA